MVTVWRDQIIIRTHYDPSLVAAIKALPGRRWNGESKTWTVPATPGHAAQVLTVARRYEVEVDNAILNLAADAQPGEPPPGAKRIEIKGDSMFIYCDFNPAVIAAFKAAKAARFSWAGKSVGAWKCPLEKATVLAALPVLKKFGFPTGPVEAIIGELDAMAQQAIEASKAKDALPIEIPGLNGELRPFQRAGVRYGVAKKRCIIGDEMGLGKTVEALAIMQHDNAFPALVVCPATLKYNWVRESRKWLPARTIQVLGNDGFGRADADITITNYDQLKNYREFLVRRDFAAMVCDESHALKNPDAQRTVFVEEIAQGVLYDKDEDGSILDRRKAQRLRSPIPLRLLMSGTPMLNKPAELVPQLRILDRLQEFGGWYGFNSRYCGLKKGRYGFVNEGAGNLVELHDKLRARCYLRRLKADVLTELPPKVRTPVVVPIDNRAEYETAQADVIKWLRREKGEEAASAATRARQLVEIEQLKRLAAKGKLAAVKSWVADFLDTGKQLVLFAWHQDIVEALAAAYQCRAIHGRTPTQARQEYVDEFQRGDKRIIVMNIQTGGVGLTLTAASDVGFVELGWNPGSMDQAGDRCHRIGQTDSVTEWWFLAKETIEEDVQDIIENKRLVIDAAIDGSEPERDVGVLNELVARLQSRG